MKNVNKFISYNNVYIIEAKLSSDTSSHNRLTKSKFIESSSICNKVLKVEIPLFKN